MHITLIRPPQTNYGLPVYLPINLLSLSSILDMNCISSTIVDFEVLLKTSKELKKDFFKSFLDFIPDNESRLYGLTAMGSNIPYALKMAEIIKDRYPYARIVLGGPHAHFLANDILSSFCYIDFVIRGEGEKPLLELAKNLDNNAYYSHINGLAYRNGESVFLNRTELTEVLDDIPVIKYDKIELSRYFVNREEYHFPIFAGTGCVGECTFCCTSAFWGRKYRMKTTKRILREILDLKEAGFRHFVFDHDNFFLNHKFVTAFIIGIKEQGIKWSACARIDSVNNEIISEAAKSGMESIFFGIESGSPDILREIKKKINLNSVVGIIKACSQNKIKVTVSFIIGFPNEKQQDIEDTLEFALQCRLNGADNVLLNPLVPLPGTPYSELDSDYGLNENSFCLRLTDDFNTYLERMVCNPEWRKVFSSFYHLKNDTITFDNICKLCSIYIELIDKYPLTINYLNYHNNVSLLDIAHYLHNKAITEIGKNASSVFDELLRKDNSLDNFSRDCLLAIMCYESTKLAIKSKEHNLGVIDFSSEIRIVRESDIDIGPYLGNYTQQPVRVAFGSSCDLVYLKKDNRVLRFHIDSNIVSALKKTLPTTKEKLIYKLNEITNVSEGFANAIINNLVENGVLL